MYRHLSLPASALALALLGCASGGGNVLRETEVRRAPTVITNADGSTTQLDTQRELMSRSQLVELPLATAYRRLRAVYDVMGIEPRSFSDRDHFVGNQHLVLRRRLGDRRLSALINCGAGLTGPRADQYEVTMSIVTQLVAEGDASTRVVTRVDASARPMGASGSAVPCSTTGMLEREIAERVGGAS